MANTKITNVSLVGKIIYLINFFWYKFLVIFECKKGRIEMVLTEFIVLLANVLGSYAWVENRLFKRSYYETIFGKFYINPTIICTYTISPSFERIDVNHLLNLMSKELKAKKKILFIDIGAYIGLYMVLVGNAFKKYHSKLDIIAIEPEANNFMGDNYNLLKKNIKVNKIKNVKLYKIGVGSNNSPKPNRFGIQTKKMDTLLGKISQRYDTVFIKMDIEGQESDALKGAGDFLKNSKKTVLLVEDFIDRRLIRSLKENNFSFLKKVSLHNSFWIRE